MKWQSAWSLMIEHVVSEEITRKETVFNCLQIICTKKPWEVIVCFVDIDWIVKTLPCLNFHFMIIISSNVICSLHDITDKYSLKVLLSVLSILLINTHLRLYFHTIFCLISSWCGVSNIGKSNGHLFSQSDFLAHLTQRVMWGIAITWRPSSIRRPLSVR